MRAARRAGWYAASAAAATTSATPAAKALTSTSVTALSVIAALKAFHRGKRGDAAGERADAHEPHGLPEHQPHDCTSRCAERHANADLLRPLLQRIDQHAGKAGHAQDERHRAQQRAHHDAASSGYICRSRTSPRGIGSSAWASGTARLKIS